MPDKRVLLPSGSRLLRSRLNRHGQCIAVVLSMACLLPLASALGQETLSNPLKPPEGFTNFVTSGPPVWTSPEGLNSTLQIMLMFLQSPTKYKQVVGHVSNVPGVSLAARTNINRSILRPLTVWS